MLGRESSLYYLITTGSLSTKFSRVMYSMYYTYDRTCAIILSKKFQMAQFWPAFNLPGIILPGPKAKFSQSIWPPRAGQIKAKKVHSRLLHHTAKYVNLNLVIIK